MPYATKLIEAVNKAPNSRGNVLGRWAVRLDLSVLRISKATGATRQTIYNWFLGKPVAPYYRGDVDILIKIMVEADTAETAWRNICNEYRLKS